MQLQTPIRKVVVKVVMWEEEVIIKKKGIQEGDRAEMGDKETKAIMELILLMALRRRKRVELRKRKSE